MNLCSHPVPEHIEKRITSKGGLAPNGQPFFRVIWGSDRLTIMGGEWKKYDDHGNEIGSIIEEKLAVKYLNAENRWIFECWCPPENYGTPEEWEVNHTKIINGQIIHELGPWPKNGEYELVKVLETPRTRAFVPLTASITDALVAVAIINRHLPHAIRMEAYRESQRKAEIAKEQHQIDLIDNMGQAFDGKTHVVVPSNISRKGKVTLS